MAIVLSLDVLMTTGIVFISDKQSVLPRWGDIFYVYFVKWSVVLGYISFADTGTHPLTVAFLIAVSIFNALRVAGTMHAVGNSKLMVDVGLINVLDRAAVGLLLLATLALAMSCTVGWASGTSEPLTATVLLVAMFIYTFNYSSNTMYRTTNNLVYFQLLFDNKKYQ
jgi:hypothetical protein